MDGRTVVITGPTSGIGKEIALGLAGLGANLVLGCRDAAAGKALASELGRGEVEQVMIRGGTGYALMVTAAPGTLLLVLTTPNAKLGLIFLDVSRAVETIKKVL